MGILYIWNLLYFFRNYLVYGHLVYRESITFIYISNPKVGGFLHILFSFDGFTLSSNKIIIIMIYNIAFIAVVVS